MEDLDLCPKSMAKNWIGNLEIHIQREAKKKRATPSSTSQPPPHSVQEK